MGRREQRDGAQKRRVPGLGLATLILVGVLTFLACSAGDEAVKKAGSSTSPSSSTAAPATTAPDVPDVHSMRVGHQLNIESNEGKMAVTVTRTRTSTKACNAEGEVPQRGLYLIASVEIVVESGTGSVNGMFFSWTTEDGETSDSLSGWTSNCGTRLGSANDLPAGSKRKGEVVFDTSSAKGSLEYGVGRVYGTWRIT